MLIRAILAFIALPGIAAFVIPLYIADWGRGRTIHVEGVLVLLFGLTILLRCVAAFYTAGKGTLAPWSPPQELVTEGLHSRSRNAMYIGVLVMLAGWALCFRLSSLWYYALGMAVLFHVRVVFFEEPWLADRHGEKWNEYRAKTPRWF